MIMMRWEWRARGGETESRRRQVESGGVGDGRKMEGEGRAGRGVRKGWPFLKILGRTFFPPEKEGEDICTSL